MPLCWCATIQGESDYPTHQEYPNCDKSCPHRKEIELILSNPKESHNS